MPSPLAHLAPILLTTPAAIRLGGWTWRTGVSLGAWATLAVLPDIDFPTRGWGAAWPPLAHGGLTHSVLFALAAAGVMTLAMRAWLGRATVGAGWAVIAALVAVSHPLMDTMTAGGRGVMLWWPVTDERVRLPFSAFVGVRHSQPAAWLEHLNTLWTETAFAICCAAIVLGWWRMRSMRQPPKEALA